ncbi:conserved hypothetical integral membrane protein [Archaeoglobus sulfaticallidus PM70-1]|uniref:Probable queuosine precursor transporter n=1 Tax=Archaeoglobus sulfaticallidus PM70-1 TaxID=387631 RepID=N0BH67_9EURY|nr:queuosine precursor transporter [Archaeoglobus sulfaticallidus]AGK61642.1 conserved hypothetical integral membrane protein [Archaeoglobus sulfaticallidus PM70-1]
MLLSEFVMWVAVTLGIVTTIAIISERFGVEIAIGIYASLTVIANIIAVKLISVGTVPYFGLLVGPAGVIVYASTFLITDIISEIYGKEIAKKTVITGFFANIVAVASIMIAVIWSPAPFMPENLLKSFDTIFSMTPRVVIASIIAYLISQTHDVYAYHFWKAKTKERFLWLRNNASTMVSQLIDTIVFITLAFYGVFDLNVLLAMITGQYLLKLTIALVDTPFMYIAVYTRGLVKSYNL